jgi:hypothetical protein
MTLVESTRQTPAGMQEIERTIVEAVRSGARQDGFGLHSDPGGGRGSKGAE